MENADGEDREYLGVSYLKSTVRKYRVSRKKYIDESSRRGPRLRQQNLKTFPFLRAQRDGALNIEAEN